MTCWRCGGRRATPPGSQLTGLTGAAVADLVAALAGGRPDGSLLRLADGAAGNPLYVTELVAALARGSRLTITEAGAAELAGGSAPGSLSAAIADRLGFVAGPGARGAAGGGPARHGFRRPGPGDRAGPQRGRTWSRRSTRRAPPGCWPSPATAWGSGIR